MASSPLQNFSVRLHLVETNEIFSLPQCHHELTLKKFKSHLELLTGIPLNFQRLQYLDEADLSEESTFEDNDIVPGGTITMRIWRQDGWGDLVAAAAKGETMKSRIQKDVPQRQVVFEMRASPPGSHKDFVGATPHAELLGPEQRKEWVAHRAFVALFIASHRGHIETVKFLLRHGADLNAKTPLGRTALHGAAAAGQVECLELLLSWGAQVDVVDSEGQTGMSLARLWGHKQCERTMVCFRWRKKSPGTVPPSSARNRASK